MLRRVSVHAAGLNELPDIYVCTDMNAASLKDAVDPAFKRQSRAFEQYAVAGILHMDHLADMAGEDAQLVVRRHAQYLASALGLSAEDVEKRLGDLLKRHAEEWKNYTSSLATRSFVRKWMRTD